MAGRGRLAGEDTREQVVSAARALFAEQGFEATSMRAIARRAGVDPRMVHHWFGSKAELLLVSAGGLDFTPSGRISEALAADPEHPGRSLVAAFLRAWDSPGNSDRFTVMVRAALSHDDDLAPVREFIGTTVLTRLLPASEGPEADLRATMVASQLIGLGIGRYLLQLPALSGPTPPLIEHYGDVITALLRGAIAPQPGNTSPNWEAQGRIDPQQSRTPSGPVSPPR